MARTVQQIKAELTTAFMADTTLAEKYGFAPGASFDATFSKVSIENLLLYIVAAAIWTHEKLFDAHKAEVEDIISQQKPHTLRWYVNKVRQFREGQSLIEGTDEYDDSSYNEDEIAGMQIVHFAAATESATTIYIKVATDNGGTKQPLSAEQLAGLQSYIAEVKDAGVRVEIINEAAYHLQLAMTIYYDPMVLNAQGMNIHTGDYPVNDAIKSFIRVYPKIFPTNAAASAPASTQRPMMMAERKVSELSFSAISVSLLAICCFKPAISSAYFNAVTESFQAM